MLRLLALAGGVAGAVALSQFPEFSQQYLQRLAGQADALSAVVAEFEASATAAGLSPEEALAELSGTPFLDRHKADMDGAMVRLTRIESDLALLRAAGPIERLAMPHRFRDAETLRATWDDFRPAVPATATGLVAGGIGFLVGWAAIGGLATLLAWPFRRRRYT